MSEIAKSQRDVDGSIKCPSCEEDLAEANLSVVDSRSRTSSARIMGGSGNVWIHAEVECDECGEVFEVGGQVGVTGLPEDV